jgi:hypothetical protein
MIAELPYKLEHGFYLESRQILLPWDSKPKDLFHLGQPETMESNGIVFFDWRFEKCLGGLSATIHVRLKRSQKLREIELMTWLSDLDSTAKDNFDRVNENLISIFGEPDKKSVSLGFPEYEWNGNNLSVSHHIFERFGEYCVLKIRRKGNCSEPIA